MIGMIVGGYIVVVAARLGVSRTVLARMLANIGIDAVLGAVPVAGDVLDAAWRANAKNARLLDQALADPKRARRSSAWVLAGLVALVIGLAVGGILLTVWFVRLLIRAIG